MNKRYAEPGDYARILHVMVDTLGVGTEHAMSAKLLAETTGESETIITKLRTFAGRVGGLQFRYEARTDPRGKGISGRISYWRFIKTADQMIDKAKREWGFKELDNQNIDHKMPPDPSRKPAPPRQTAPEPIPAADEETQIQRELRKARKSDVEALIEAIRQYGNREAFIEEELKRFADMGIDIDPSAIKFTPNETYEVAQPLVTLIDKLYAANERQAAQIKAKGDSAATSARESELKMEIAGLKDELRRARNGHTDFMAQSREKAQKQDRRIKELEEELRKTATRRLADVAAG